MFYIISFIFGLVFGSFLSVLIYRVKNQEKGIFFWRSKCPKCNHILSAKDLVPIFSYLIFSGKCSYCWEKISIIYPLLELTTGVFFVFISWLILWTWNLQVAVWNLPYVLYWWAVALFVVAIIFYDILFLEISFLFAGILWVLLILPQFLWIIWDWKQALILAVVGFLIFVLIGYIRLKFRKIEWIWWWDAIGAVLVAFMIPILIDLLNLSYPAWLVYYIVILLGFILAGIVAIPIYLLKKNSKIALPFLPFMFFAVVVFVFVGKYILELL